jgi:HK97 family phage portal protein
LAGFWRGAIEFFRGKSEQRSIDGVPWGHGGGSPVRSPGQALNLIPFFASVRVLAEQISSLPIQTFRQDGDIAKRITDPQLVKNPSVVVLPVTWTRQAVISLATKGNAIGLITGIDGFGFATGIEWIPWEQVYVDELNPIMPRYWWANPVGDYHEIPRERVVHLTWFTEPGHVVGLSPIRAFARSIGVGLAATNYGATWFDSGGVPPSTFKNVNKTITPEQIEEVTDRLVSSLRHGRPLVYGNDWDFNAVQITPEEAQFIETMRMNATQIAAIFGIPPEWVGGETGGSYTYSSPEQNGLYTYKMVLLPWVTIFEQALSRLLPERQFVKLNADAILRADLKTRYEAHKLAIDAGFLSVDEVREIENRPPRPKPKTPAPIPVPVDPNAPPTDPNNPDVQPEAQPKANGTNGRHMPVLSGLIIGRDSK